MYINYGRDESRQRRQVWTALDKLTWRQRLALRWRAEFDSNTDDSFVFSLLIFSGTLMAFLFVLLSISIPLLSNEGRWVSWLFYVSVVGLAVGMLVIILTSLAKRTRARMHRDPRFRFPRMQAGTPSYVALNLWLKARPFLEPPTFDEWTVINQWLLERWQDDHEALSFRSDDVKEHKNRLDTVGVAIASFELLERLMIPVTFIIACDDELDRLRTKYRKACQSQIGVLKRSRAHEGDEIKRLQQAIESVSSDV